MAEDFRTTLQREYDPSDAFTGACTLCSTEQGQVAIEVFRHRRIPVIFALPCPKRGAPFQVDMSGYATGSRGPRLWTGPSARGRRSSRAFGHSVDNARRSGVDFHEFRGDRINGHRL